MRKKMPKIDYQKLGLILLLVIVINTLFMIIDYFTHSLSTEYAVPPRYFPNKLILALPLAFIALLLVKKYKPLLRSVLFSVIVSVVIQLRYLFEGYPLDFVFLFMLLHTIMLFVISYALFRFLEYEKVDIF